jgi:lysozyme family protein
MAAVALLTVTPKFKRSDAVTAAWEGGYSDHPADPGGRTDRGITQATLNDWTDAHGMARRTVKGISAELATRIFFENYWGKAKCEGLAPGVDLATYDASVNSGVSQGRKWLLASVGGTPDDTVRKICARRLGFVQLLTTWTVFGNGWSRRIAGIEAKGVAWALAAGNDDHVVAQQLGDEAGKATKIAVNQGKAAGGGIAVSGGSGAGRILTPENADQAAGLLLGGLIVLGVLAFGFFVIRAMINLDRAKAYEREAGALS